MNSTNNKLNKKNIKSDNASIDDTNMNNMDINNMNTSDMNTNNVNTNDVESKIKMKDVNNDKIINNQANRRREKALKRAKNFDMSKIPPKRSLLGNIYAALGILWANFKFKIIYENQENIPPTTPYVLAPNHQTYIDGLLVAYGLPKNHVAKLCALVGADLKTNHGKIGKLMTVISRPIYVDRANNRKAVRTLIDATNTCTADNIILVHPEGTRTHDGKVAPLHSGAAYIAFRSCVPLVPIYIAGGFDAFSRFDKYPKRKNPKTGKKYEIRIIFGRALNFQDYNSAQELNDALYNWLIEQENLFFAQK